MKNESASIIIYAILVSTAIFITALMIAKMGPQIFKIKRQLHKEVLSKVTFKSILDYTTYGVQNRQCLTEQLAFDLSCPSRSSKIHRAFNY